MSNISKIYKEESVKNNELNNNNKMEEKIMKYSIKELCSKLNLSEGSVRMWIRKYVEGEVYRKDNINYKELCYRVRERFNEKEILERLNCKIEEVEIVIGEKKRNDYVGIDKMEVGKNYIIRNYSFEKEYLLVGVYEDEDNEYLEGNSIFIFKDVINNKYNCMSYDELMKKNINIKEVVEY